MDSQRSVIIMAAGKGTRLEPLTKTVPKPLIKVAGNTILWHNMKSLSRYVDEFVIVVGYLSDLIKAEFGDTFEGKPIKYVIQEEQKGTGHAVKVCKEYVSHDMFFVINGDDLYDPMMFEMVIRENMPVIVGKTIENWQQFGVLQASDEGHLVRIVEKPKDFVGSVVNIGVYFFSREIFDYLDSIPLSIRGEYELTDGVSAYVSHHLMKVLSSDGYWLTIGYPWHILQANNILLPALTPSNNGTIEDYVVVKGRVSIGHGTVIKSGTYIDGNVIIGENCVIGPNSYIRGNTIIGDSCRIGNGVEIEHSSIGNKVNIEHLSFVGYSVLGNNIILGGGTITADRRHDRDTITVNIKEELINTQLHHLGAIIGDNVRTGIHTSIYPGRKLAYHSYTVPGEVVKQDKLSSHDIVLK